MNFEHVIGLSWVHESMDAETKRPCARLREADREAFAVISVRRSCHGLDVSNGVHPSDGTGILPVTPSRRIAAGHAARTFESPRAGRRMIGIGKPENHFSGSCENAREMRA
jgi:hypothetical protein